MTENVHRAGDHELSLLTATTLFPNAVTPNHGVFIENRLRHLRADEPVGGAVIAPVPWFPSGGAVFGRFAQSASVPRVENRFGMDVLHPRYLTVPKLGSWTTPIAIYRAYLRAARALMAKSMRFDAVDGHFFYPDGAAAVLLARKLGLPVVVTARGSDITYLPTLAYQRAWIRWTIRQADALAAVSESLRQAIIRLGAPEDKVVTLRNGVDIEALSPQPREAARSRFDIPYDKPVIASVGNLIPLKGHDLVIRALGKLPDAHLMVVGGGPEETNLRRLSAELALAGRVHFLGRVPHDQMHDVYSAADVLVLASSREGWPNVLLEAMACGTPVAATGVGGIPEIITVPESGVVVPERSTDAIAMGVRRILAADLDSAATRAYAETFSWKETSRGQYDLFWSLSRNKEPDAS